MPFADANQSLKKVSQNITYEYLRQAVITSYDKDMVLVPSKSFIWVTSKYLGSCWFYRKTKATLLYQTTLSASNGPSFRFLGETFVK